MLFFEKTSPPPIKNEWFLDFLELKKSFVWQLFPAQMKSFARFTQSGILTTESEIYFLF